MQCMQIANSNLNEVLILTSLAYKQIKNKKEQTVARPRNYQSSNLLEKVYESKRNTG